MFKHVRRKHKIINARRDGSQGGCLSDELPPGWLLEIKVIYLPSLNINLPNGLTGIIAVIKLTNYWVHREYVPSSEDLARSSDL
jgi:hypothetical protein